MSPTTAVEVDEVTKSFGPGDAPALDRVSLTVSAGESVVVVGPNGAGKSTLLGVIAGVTAPTSGSVRRPERCASLLQLGAAFHPDLTGVENLELQLRLAGMGARERRLARDDAIDLAGLGGAVTEPVGRYSSGMLARLSLASAISSSPDLLLVDEVLAVGDAAFQRRSLSRVADLVAGGTALVLVTHSIDLARLAGERAIWIENGSIRADGRSGEILDRYDAEVRGWGRRRVDRGVTVRSVELDPVAIEPGQRVRVRSVIRCLQPTDQLSALVNVRPAVGDDSFWMRAPDETPEDRAVNLVARTDPVALGPLCEGDHVLEVTIDTLPITPTRLDLGLAILDADGATVDEAEATLDVGSVAMRPYLQLDLAPGPGPRGSDRHSGRPTRVTPPTG